MEVSVIPTNASQASRLCGKCEKMDFWATRFSIVDTWPELESSRTTCDFCKMRWEVSKNLNRKDYTLVSFERVDSMLRMNDGNSPILSVCRSPGKFYPEMRMVQDLGH